MSSVQVPAYTTASTSGIPLDSTPSTILPTTTTITSLPVTTLPTTTILPTTTLPIVSGKKVKSGTLKRNGTLRGQSATSILPTIASVPIVATDAGPIYEIELKKRLLDGQRELKEKQADMEADKEKKLEEKADKHRTKAVKWIGRGYPGLAARHEKAATKLDVLANEHYMVAEQLRAQAKAIDRERKSFDPPKEDKKKPAAKGAAMRRPAPASDATRAPPSSSSAPPRSAAPQPAPVSNNQVPQQRRDAVQPQPQPQLQPQPSLQKTERVVDETQPSLRKEEQVVSQPTAEPVVVEEIKTEKKIEQTPDGDKVEKKEEKHHHLHHSEKHEQTAGGSSH